MTEILIRLDAEEARALLDSLDDLGEHWASGWQVPFPPQDIFHKLERVREQIRTQLGVPSLAERMAEEMEIRRLAGVAPEEHPPAPPILDGPSPAPIPAWLADDLEMVRSSNSGKLPADRKEAVMLARTLGRERLARWIALNSYLYRVGLNNGFAPDDSNSRGAVN